MKQMIREIGEARRALEKFSEEQINFGRRAHEDILSCWGIDGTDDEQVYAAIRAEKEAKLDWMVQGIEDDLLENDEEFEELIWAISTVDNRSLAYI